MWQHSQRKLPGTQTINKQNEELELTKVLKLYILAQNLNNFVFSSQNFD
jgi:hypothetical protein